MQDALRRFHPFKDVVLFNWAGKKVKTEANALRTELAMKRKIDKETNAETRTLSKKWPEMNVWRDYISPKLDVSK